jgi:hypothetical protein
MVHVVSDTATTAALVEYGTPMKLMTKATLSPSLSITATIYRYFSKLSVVS